MAGNLEIERKFLARQLPEGLPRARSSRIVQGYFPLDARILEIRLRRKGSQHFTTFKAGKGRKRLEVEIKITASQFRALWPLTQAAQLAKRRYKIPWAGHTIDLDAYEGPHRGLVTAEVEFDGQRASRHFKPPRWFGHEITGQRQFTNETLARRHRLPASLKRR